MTNTDVVAVALLGLAGGLLGGLITALSPGIRWVLPGVFGARGSTASGAGPGEDRMGDGDEDLGLGLRQVVGGTATVAESISVGRPGRDRPELDPRDLRALEIVTGVAVGFGLLALLVSTLSSALGPPRDLLRWADVVLLGAIGAAMAVPPLGHLIERPLHRLPRLAGGVDAGPYALGAGLGVLYLPCAGAILAAVGIVAGGTGGGAPGRRTVVLTVAFAIGVAAPLLVLSAGALGRAGAAGPRHADRLGTGGGLVVIALAIALALHRADAIPQRVPADSVALQGSLSPVTNAGNRALSRCAPGAGELGSCGRAPELKDTQRWFNTAAGATPTLAGLRGKVVLIDFFAYSCINCQRDEPYVEKWYDAYQDDGLQVIGVHSPEFAFEKSAGNLEGAIKAAGITYPVVQDNDLANFNDYRSTYWPAKYLLDPTGTVRAITLGEGGYGQTETLIRQLLTARDPGVELPAPVTDVTTNAGGADTTPEAKLSGYLKTDYDGGTGGFNPGAGQSFNLQTDQPADTYSLGGVWDVGSESVTSTGRSQVKLHYHATQVNLVLSGTGIVTVSEPGRPDRVIQVAGRPDRHTLIQNDQSTDETIVVTVGKGLSAYTFSFG